MPSNLFSSNGILYILRVDFGGRCKVHFAKGGNSGYCSGRVKLSIHPDKGR